jgi:RNA polymerase sigma-70 factor (ECF subfamily)
MATPGTAGMERLVTEYGERAFQFAYRLTGNAEDARELVQEAFYRVLRNWDGYDHNQPLENWFFTILRHLFLDGLRRYDRANVLSLDAPQEEADEEFAEILEDRADVLLEALEREESGRSVRRAFQRLTAEHRAALTLADLDGMTYEEIAKVLRCPVGTVRSRVSRARDALKRLLTRGVAVRD